MSRPRLSVTQTQRLQLTPGLKTSIHLLRADAAGLTRYLEEQANGNPHLRLDPAPAPAIGDWLPRWTGAFGPGSSFSGAGRMRTDAPGVQDATDHATAPPASLMAHVLGAIDGMALAPRAQRIAFALAEALEPSGWLGKPLQAVAEDVGVTLGEIEPVLARLQRIEPAGLFARSLAECLALQLADTGEMDAVMQVILGRLDLLGAGDLARLAKLARTSQAEVVARFRTIRSLDPKPGARFAALSAAALREPDLLVRQSSAGGDWEVSLNRSCMPTVSVVRDGKERKRTEQVGLGQVGLGQAGSGQVGLGQGGGTLAAARAVARLVASRNNTLLRVGREVLLRQRAALDLGPAALVAMTMAEVAEALDLHESTVSRVVSGASVDTPRGTWWLRRLFSARAGDAAGAPSGAAVQARLAHLVATEPKAAPLSDAALATALAAGGVAVARRTVTKYRAALGIPAAHRRRKRAREKPQAGA